MKIDHLPLMGRPWVRWCRIAHTSFGFMGFWPAWSELCTIFVTPPPALGPINGQTHTVVDEGRALLHVPIHNIEVGMVLNLTSHRGPGHAADEDKDLCLEVEIL
uniref:Uncharacterized protein n=1 Tax=Eutreptiella gymnastica TaxID=73025 RepID=A0A7S1IBX6_9EUGL